MNGAELNPIELDLSKKLSNTRLVLGDEPINDGNECLLCFDKLNTYSTMVDLPCRKIICNSCCILHYTEKLSSSQNPDLSCPHCFKPNLREDSVEADQFLSNLKDILSKHLNQICVDNLNKIISNRKIGFHPDFARCPALDCQFGYIPSGNGLKQTCVECDFQFCRKCEKRWMEQHTTISCKQFAQWVTDNDVSGSQTGSERYLAEVVESERGLIKVCLRCKHKYILEIMEAQCMHITCECSFQYCRGCNQTFRPSNADCARVNCTIKGLHAHHPRYCGFYLRDYTVTELLSLLTSANVIPRPSTSPQGICIHKNREEEENVRPCRNRVVYNLFKCCREHSQAYLAELIRKHRIDPIPIMSLNEVMMALKRLGHKTPERGPWDDDVIYKAACSEILKAIPMDYK